jgi:ABC-type Zn2+ transport system substrate-binding protein/surface adhesin
MSVKTKTMTIAALAALTVPAAAAADKPSQGETGKSRGAEHSHGAKHSHGAEHNHGAEHSHRAEHSHKDGAKAKKAKGKGFVVKGVDFGGATLTDGALAGALTLDPTSANRHARRLLELKRTAIAGEDTVTFGKAGDKVRVRYVGLQSTDALLATDVVKVVGKVKGGELDLRTITIKRARTESPDRD